MARFDVHRNPTDNPDVPYLIDIQSDLLSGLRTRVVVPLVPVERFAKPMTRLNPIFEIDGQRLVMATTDLAGVDSRALGEVVGTLKDRHYEIIGAVDFLLSGF